MPTMFFPLWNRVSSAIACHCLSGVFRPPPWKWDASCVFPFVKPCVACECVFNRHFQTASLRVGCAKFHHFRDSGMPTMFLHLWNSVSPVISFLICVFRPHPWKWDVPDLTTIVKVGCPLCFYIRETVCRPRLRFQSAFSDHLRQSGMRQNLTISVKVGCPLCYSICETVCRPRMCFLSGVFRPPQPPSHWERLIPGRDSENRDAFFTT